MSVENATQFCQLVENRLGWVPPAKWGWKQYAAEAGKVNRKVASDPELYTWRNLELAVELLAREKLERTPIGVFAHVQRAVALAVESEDEVEAEIRKVVAYETSRGDPNGWVVRFARATGLYRRQALQEWRESARG